MTSPAAGFERLLEALNRLEIPYMVGGSLASSIHSIPRSTNDVDIIADLPPRYAGPLVELLQPDFYVDRPDAVEGALRAGRMFNLIHLASGYKFDIYPLPPDPYSHAAFARRLVQCYSFGGQTLRFYVSSPEDVILAKLCWYRDGGRVSERQWSDVLDVSRIQKGLLDLTYLRRWAAALAVTDLLEEALA